MFKKERYNLARFWELFNPTTNNFQFWLASAAFSFFAYTSLWEVGMNPQVVLAWGFQIFGWFCVAMLVYLFISWVVGFRIKTPAERKAEKAKKAKAKIKGEISNGKSE